MLIHEDYARTSWFYFGLGLLPLTLAPIAALIDSSEAIQLFQTEMPTLLTS